jgi:hypothetical protein
LAAAAEGARIQDNEVARRKRIQLRSGRGTGHRGITGPASAPTHGKPLAVAVLGIGPSQGVRQTRLGLPPRGTLTIGVTGGVPFVERRAVASGRRDRGSSNREGTDPCFVVRCLLSYLRSRPSACWRSHPGPFGRSRRRSAAHAVCVPHRRSADVRHGELRDRPLRDSGNAEVWSGRLLHAVRSPLPRRASPSTA